MTKDVAKLWGVSVPSYAFFSLFLLLGFHQVRIFRGFLLSFVLLVNVSIAVILQYLGIGFNLNLLNLENFLSVSVLRTENRKK